MPQHHALDEFREYTTGLLAESGSTSATTAQTHSRAWQQRWRSPQVALASLGFLVFGNLGIAAASNSAVPGDLLYPVDRAYESAAGLVGLDLGGAPERLEEAAVLIDRGEFETAIEPLAAAAAQIDDAVGASIANIATQLGNESGSGDLRKAAMALHATVQAMIEGDSETDLDEWKEAIDDRVEDLTGANQGQPSFLAPGDEFVPPGQDDNFVPPGQDDNFVPPGKDQDFVPPGQESKNKTPPGKDDDFTPPGHDRKNTNNKGRKN
jgi:hypothetical protein